MAILTFLLQSPGIPNTSHDRVLGGMERSVGLCDDTFHAEVDLFHMTEELAFEESVAVAWCSDSVLLGEIEGNVGFHCFLHVDVDDNVPEVVCAKFGILGTSW